MTSSHCPATNFRNGRIFCLRFAALAVGLIVLGGESSGQEVRSQSTESRGVLDNAPSSNAKESTASRADSRPSSGQDHSGSGLALHLRSLSKEGKPSVKEVVWKPEETALIICDMWDDHWCKSAANRVAEMAPTLNETVKAAREKGVLIIHAPSSVIEFYKNTPQRLLAKNAPYAKPPIKLSDSPRWGTMWCWPDPKFESVLPIDDSDMGCSCKGKKCEVREAWTRQIKSIDLEVGDALTHSGQEVINLLAERKIKNVMLCGVHLNMCVLGRPFGIRQMVQLGKNVALVRDLTDTMYNPERPPGVDHFTGTDLVIGHVEKHWCPSFVSSDITGKHPFKFADDKRDSSFDQ